MRYAQTLRLSCLTEIGRGSQLLGSLFKTTVEFEAELRNGKLPFRGSVLGVTYTGGTGKATVTIPITAEPVGMYWAEPKRVFIADLAGDTQLHRSIRVFHHDGKAARIQSATVDLDGVQADISGPSTVDLSIRGSDVVPGLLRGKLVMNVFADSSGSVSVPIFIRCMPPAKRDEK